MENDDWKKSRRHPGDITEDALEAPESSNGSFIKWVVIVLGIIAVGLYTCHAKANIAKVADSSYVIILDGGVDKWEEPPDRLWWQSGYTNEKQFGSYYARIGAFFPINSKFSLGGSLFTLGRTKMRAEATQDEDKHAQHLCPAQCAAPDLYETENSIWGFAVTGRYERIMSSNFEFEAGLTYYLHEFYLKASGLTAGSQYGYGPNATPTEFQEAIWGVGSLVILTYNTEQQWRVGGGVHMGGSGGHFNSGAFPAGTGDFTYFLFVGKAL